MGKYIIASIIGALLGYIYYKKIGCASGTCPITSNKYVSIIYGALLANLFVYIIASIIGALLGYIYYKKIGCASGTCPITSNKYVSIIYGALLANLFVS